MIAGRLFLLLGALYGLLAVVLGAAATHALRGQLSDQAMIAFHTGVEYQFYHVFALLAVGLLCQVRPAPGLAVAGWCFVAGVLLFCGSLYLWVLGGPHGLVYVTPVGGLLFMAGWVALIWAVMRLK